MTKDTINTRMKKLLPLLFISVFFTNASFSQPDDDDDGERLRDKLIEYVSEKLSLSASESQKMKPLMIQYLRELRQTNKQYKERGLDLQQKVVELRLRYRNQFKDIIGDKRSNEVFEHEREFLRKIKEIRDQRMKGRNNRILENTSRIE